MTILSGTKNTVFLWVLLLLSCGNSSKSAPAIGELIKTAEKTQTPNIIVAANRTTKYLPLLQNKQVGIVANQTSVIFKTTTNAKKLSNNYVHLVDSLLTHGIQIKKVFAPEHGFRGQADAGETVADGIDTKTGLPLISLYGKNKKPSSEQLKDIDIVLFDIQDVGVRFYTYIATLQLVMEACAFNNIPVIVLDRPNPNGGYIDGPTMKPEHTSFLGMTPIPLVYGLTIGEYATLINEEGWLQDGLKVDLTLIPLKNYTPKNSYSLAIRPSPNLPNDLSIALYPSLGFFEGTYINAGRGTENQFQRYGASFLDSTAYDFSYTPISNFGAKYPKEKGKICYGKDLSSQKKPDRIRLKWLLDAYANSKDQSLFFNTSSFTKHAGTEELQQQIEAGMSEEAIRQTWQKDLNTFAQIRKKYTLYD